MLTIELARRQRRWTQTDLSQLTGITQAFISLIELGRGIPTPDQLQRLADALAMPPDLVLKPVDLIGATTEMPNPVQQRVVLARLEVERLERLAAQLEAEERAQAEKSA